MNRSMEERYVTHLQIPTLSKKLLYTGEDLSLQREVIFYRIENLNSESADEYIRKFKKASSFVHSGFQHILDTSIDEHSIFIVLKHRSGKPLLPQLKQQNWTFFRILTLISDLGASMLDGMEEQITGYSVGVENLWLSEDDRLSVINYWEDGEPQNTGALGLCSLIIQLSSGTAQIPDPFKALDNYLLQIELLHASSEQKSELIKMFRRAYHGQASLSSLVIGLQSLLHMYKHYDEDKSLPAPASAAPASVPLSRNQAQQQLPTSAPVSSNIQILPPEHLDDEEDEEEEESDIVPFYKRKTSIAVGLLVAAVLIWFLWPTLQSTKNPSEVDPTTIITPTPTAIVTDQPTPSSSNNATIGEGQEIVIPNLVGMIKADAETQALASGLHYKYYMEMNKEASVGTVFKQDPAPDTKAVKGDTVNFWVSK